MRFSLSLGKIAGIPLLVHPSWFLTAVLVVWSLSAGFFPQQLPGWEPSVYWAAGLLAAGSFFLSILIHELGHALVALREGVPVRSITLFILGGVAHIASEPPTAWAELRIVSAGPFASLLLSVLFGLLSAAPGLHPALQAAAVYLAGVNLLLALFNLLPGFPLDGGRILRALLWAWKKDFSRATRWAVHAGLGLSLLFVLAGLALIALTHFFNGLWLVFTGLYLGNIARDGYRQAVEAGPVRLVRPAAGPTDVTVPHRGQGAALAPGGQAAALFGSFAGVERALRSLREAGYSAREVRLLAHESVLSTLTGPGSSGASGQGLPGSPPGIGAYLLPLPGAARGAASPVMAALGLSGGQALAWAEAVQRGAILVSVHAGEERAAVARAILAWACSFH